MTERILVVRNDKLGDFMLSWRALAVLRRSLPDASIHVLVPEYTREIASLCSSVDDVVVDPGGQYDAAGLARILQQHNYSAVIAMFSTLRVALACTLARIPLRVAPATKLAQVFCTHRVTQRRSRSEKPEYEYNADLVRYMLTTVDCPVNDDVKPPYLVFGSDELAEVRQRFLRASGISSEQRLLFLHPGSGGSARNLSLAQYRQLADDLGGVEKNAVVLCAGPGEETRARELKQRMSAPAYVFESTQGLAAYARHIALCDMFISGSTGPLHVAGVLNRPTAAFYTRRRSATALRWQTLNDAAIRLVFSPPDGAEEEDMSTIHAAAAADSISQFLLAE